MKRISILTSVIVCCVFGSVVQASPNLADGSYTLRNQKSKLVLDDPGLSVAPGTQMIQWPTNGGANQSWIFSYNSQSDAYLIKNGSSQLFLSDISGKLDQQYEDMAGNQLWTLLPVSGGFIIQNKITGNVIDDPGSSLTKGTRIVTDASTQSTDQIWIVQSVNGVPIPQPPPPPVPTPKPTAATRTIYAVNESSSTRGTISVYDIDNGHKLIRTIKTVSGVGDVRGVAASAVTGKLYVSYQNGSSGMMFAVDLATDKILWNQKINPGIDRMAISPDGQLIYSPTSEDQSNTYINVLDANTGAVDKKVYFSSRSHDTQYPMSGPVFQETKAKDGTGRYLYMIDPQSMAVSKVGPFHDFLGPYAVDYSSSYAVADVNGVTGFQVVDIRNNKIASAYIPNPPGGVSLPHGIGWTPDQTEVWQNTTGYDPHVYIWDMHNPMQPIFKERLNLHNGGSHWITFDIRGDYAYIAPNKNSGNGTEIFSVASHTSVGMIPSSEDMLEVDFDSTGKVSTVGDQYGIGR